MNVILVRGNPTQCYYLSVYFLRFQWSAHQENSDQRPRFIFLVVSAVPCFVIQLRFLWKSFQISLWFFFWKENRPKFFIFQSQHAGNAFFVETLLKYTWLEVCSNAANGDWYIIFIILIQREEFVRFHLRCFLVIYEHWDGHMQLMDSIWNHYARNLVGYPRIFVESSGYNKLLFTGQALSCHKWSSRRSMHQVNLFRYFVKTFFNFW